MLALLDETLRVMRQALIAAQPALAGEPPPRQISPERIAAQRILRDAAKLDRSIAIYRPYVLRVLHDGSDRDDDLPF